MFPRVDQCRGGVGDLGRAGQGRQRGRPGGGGRGGGGGGRRGLLLLLGYVPEDHGLDHSIDGEPCSGFGPAYWSLDSKRIIQGWDD